MLTFNKDAVFVASTEAHGKKNDQALTPQEVEQEHIRQNMLTAARQAGGINDEMA